MDKIIQFNINQDNCRLDACLDINITVRTSMGVGHLRAALTRVRVRVRVRVRAR